MARKNIFKLITAVFFLVGLGFYTVDFKKSIALLLVGIILIAVILIRYFLKIYAEYNIKLLLPKIIFLLLYIVSSMLFLELFPSLGFIAKLLFLLISTVILYALLLAVNIHLVVEKQDVSIPLLQPARVVIFISNVVITFLGTTVIYKLSLFINYPFINLTLKFVVFIVFFYLLFKLCSKYVYIGFNGGGGGYKLSSTIMFSVVVLSETAVVLMFFPFEAFGRALILSAVTYSVLSLVQAIYNHKVNIRLYVGTFSIVLFAYLLAYFL